MSMNRIRSQDRSWKSRALQAATILALAVGSNGSSADEVHASAPAPALLAQATSEDPCRHFTAQEMGKAFGRPMQSSKLADVCQYRGTPNGLVVVRVKAGPEGTILQHAKTAAAQGQKISEKLTTKVGEAYFESVVPAFVGHVGKYDVQIETDIEPVPRGAMIAVGTRIMESLAGK